MAGNENGGKRKWREMKMAGTGFYVGMLRWMDTIAISIMFDEYISVRKQLSCKYSVHLSRCQALYCC